MYVDVVMNVIDSRYRCHVSLPYLTFTVIRALAIYHGTLHAVCKKGRCRSC